MILYHAVNTYQLMICILHGLKNYDDQKKVLLLPNFIVRSIPQYRQLVTMGFFDDIYLINYSKYNGKDKDFIIENVQMDFNLIFSKDIELDKFEMFYLGAAHYYFSLYLILHNKNFCVIEDGAGLLSRHSLLEKTLINQHVMNVDLLNQIGMLDLSNPKIIKKICLVDAQEEGFYDSLAENFDIAAELKEISKQDLNKLLRFWNCPCVQKTKSTDAVMMTQNFANLNQMSFETQMLIYQTVIDYFVKEKNLIIKPHPNDLMFYEKIINKPCLVIREKFPSELLPFIFEEQPESIYNISSTGIYLLRRNFKEVYSLGLQYEKNFFLTLRYYLVTRFAECIKSNIAYVGNHENIIINLRRTSNLSSYPTQIRIVDGMEELSLDVIGQYEYIIFMNSDDSYNFATLFKMSDIYVKVIKKRKIRDDYVVANTKNEYLYFWCKKSEGYNMVKKFNYKERLENTGIEAELEEDSELSEYVKQLEGYNRALEKRLNYYINIFKEEQR